MKLVTFSLMIYMFSFLIVLVFGGIFVGCIYVFGISLFIALRFILFGVETQYPMELLIDNFWIVRYVLLGFIVILPIYFTKRALQGETMEEITTKKYTSKQKEK